jgi:hypothetical protein
MPSTTRGGVWERPRPAPTGTQTVDLAGAVQWIRQAASDSAAGRHVRSWPDRCYHWWAGRVARSHRWGRRRRCRSWARGGDRRRRGHHRRRRRRRRPRRVSETVIRRWLPGARSAVAWPTTMPGRIPPWAVVRSLSVILHPGLAVADGHVTSRGTRAASAWRRTAFVDAHPVPTSAPAKTPTINSASPVPYPSRRRMPSPIWCMALASGQNPNTPGSRLETAINVFPSSRGSSPSACRIRWVGHDFKIS